MVQIQIIFFLNHSFKQKITQFLNPQLEKNTHKKAENVYLKVETLEHNETEKISAQELKNLTRKIEPPF